MPPPKWFPVSVVSAPNMRVAHVRIKGHGNHGNQTPRGDVATGDIARRRNVEEPPLWRAVAHHYTAEGDGHWHGKWQDHSQARAQALRWQQRDEPDAVWIETLHGDRHEVTS